MGGMQHAASEAETGEVAAAKQGRCSRPTKLEEAGGSPLITLE